jgi:outer membrane protein assembly factor BamB
MIELDLSNLDASVIEHPALYVDPQLVVYQQQTVVKSVHKNGQSFEVSVPSDEKLLQYVDLGNGKSLLVGKTYIIALDKSTGGLQRKDISETLYTTNIKCVTPAADKNTILIVSEIIKDQIQIIKYNYVMDERQTQTAYWAGSKASCIHSEGDIITLLCDNKNMVTYDMSTGKVVWVKSPTSPLAMGAAHYNGYIYYSIRNMIMATNGENNKRLKTPKMVIEQIVGESNGRLVVTGEKNKGLCAYNLEKEQVEWELRNPLIFEEGVFAQSTDGVPLLVARTMNKLNIINLEKGHTIDRIKMPGISGLREIDDRLLIYISDRKTAIMPTLKE